MRYVLLVAPNRAAGGAFGDMFQGDGVLGATESPVKATMAPVELATLAALAPAEFEIDIWDEAVLGRISPSTQLSRQYDLVGVTGYLENIPRMLAIREEFRRRGIMTIAGGPAVSSSPQRFRGIFDVIFLGEAELTWPQFLREWVNGTHMPEYRQIERPDLADSPIPNWEKVAGVATSYSVAGVQTTRGCPFDCEFCDVIHLYGRKPRHKPVTNVIEEIRALERLGVRQVLLSDDNLYGDPRYAKEFLRALIPVNNSFEHPLAFHTMITINVAKDDEMMRLLSEANFMQLFIGIETPRKASLLEIHKIQNMRGDMVEDVRRIQSYGVFVTTLLIVGFDNDDLTIFDEVYEFLQSASTAHYRCHLLQSLPGTPQTARLLKEGRVMELEGESEEIASISNVIPAKMSREELFEGYIGLEERLMDWTAFGERLIGAIRCVKYVPEHARKKKLPDQQRMRRAAKMIGAMVNAPRPVRAMMFKTLTLLLSIKARRQAADNGQGAAMDTSGFVKLFKWLESLQPEARRVAVAVLQETVEHAPWMMRETLLRVAVQRDYVRGLEVLKGRLRKRLAVEKAPGYEHKILATVQIPPGFKRVYREQFAITLAWLRDGLKDSRLVPEGLVLVWKDFVVRYGATFEKFEDYHISSLKELVERTIEQGNNGLYSPRSMAQVDNITSTQTRFLADHVMLAVEQDLKSEGADANVTLGPAASHAKVDIPLSALASSAARFAAAPAVGGGA